MTILDNGNIGAYVHGRDIYWVNIDFKGREVESMWCDCPYGDDCKHEAALLYYIDDHMELLNLPDYSNFLFPFTKEELVEFLEYEFQYSPELLERFKLFWDNHVDFTDYFEKLKSCLSDSQSILKFMDCEIQYLIKLQQFTLIFELFTRMLNHINNELKHGDFPLLKQIILKMDSIITQMSNIASSDDITDFLVKAIDDTDSEIVDEILFDCLACNGDADYFLNR